MQGAGGLASLLGPERMAALLPKLYRLTHDPSPKVQLSTAAAAAAAPLAANTDCRPKSMSQTNSTCTLKR
jgi:hypothetical protein